MLYPTLFREATGLENLEFQVAPGIAEAEVAKAQGLLTEGGAVAFLLDGDSAGQDEATTTRRQRGSFILHFLVGRRVLENP